jgi:hypothetical protein
MHGEESFACNDSGYNGVKKQRNEAYKTRFTVRCNTNSVLEKQLTEAYVKNDNKLAVLFVLGDLLQVGLTMRSERYEIANWKGSHVP